MEMCGNSFFVHIDILVGGRRHASGFNIVRGDYLMAPSNNRLIATPLARYEINCMKSKTPSENILPSVKMHIFLGRVSQFPGGEEVDLCMEINSRGLPKAQPHRIVSVARYGKRDEENVEDVEPTATNKITSYPPPFCHSHETKTHQNQARGKTRHDGRLTLGVFQTHLDAFPVADPPQIDGDAVHRTYPDAVAVMTECWPD